MIISRSPLRISVAGGATDLPSYSNSFGGFLISVAIDKHVYTTIHHTTNDEIILRYSQIEKVKSAEIKHPIIREALKLTGITETNIEITSADLSSNSGLKSLSSFTCALLKSLFRFKNKTIDPKTLAELACKIEIEILNQPIGRQDQFSSSFGGLNSFIFNKDGSVIVKPINISEEKLNQLEENLVMISVGYHRSASSILKEQDDKSKELDPDMINNLHYVKEMGYRALDILESSNEDLIKLGMLFDEHWQHKKKRSKSMSNPEIDKWYEGAINNGAIGGKICGAGGGGHLLFYTEDKKRLLSYIKSEGLHDIKFKFDYEGTKIL